MKTFAMIDAGATDAAAWPALAAGLQRAGEPALACATLAGAALCTGRHQHAPSALTDEGLGKPRARRASGGRTVALGEGVMALALALPHKGWLVGEGPEALGCGAFVNRAVRGLLSGLARLGVAASYGGRDFAAWAGAQGAYVSFDVDAQGRALFEAFVPGAAHWWPPEALVAPAPPFGRGFPPPALHPRLAALDGATLLRECADGFAERFALRPAPAGARIEPVEPAGPALGARARRAATPAGRLEATVELSRGRIARAAFAGDLLADSGGVEAWRVALEGAAAEQGAILAATASVFDGGAHALLGATAEELAAAVAAAAGA